MNPTSTVIIGHCRPVMSHAGTPTPPQHFGQRAQSCANLFLDFCRDKTLFRPRAFLAPAHSSQVHTAGHLDQSSGFMSEPQPTRQNTPPAVRLCGSFRGAQAAGIAVDLTTHSSDFWRFPRSQTTLKSRCYFPGPLLRPTTSQQAPSTLVSSMVGPFRPEQPYTPDPCSMLAHRILDHSGSMIR